MKSYIKPSYELENIEAQDVVLASVLVEDLGTGTLGEITGKKVQASMSFDSLFGLR